jgi:tyrosyl-tRNA synthetase
VFTFRTRAEIEALEQSTAERPHLREAQRTLAYDVTSLIHGVDATEKVIAASAALFGQGELGQLDEPPLTAAPPNCGRHTSAGDAHHLDCSRPVVFPPAIRPPGGP